MSFQLKLFWWKSTKNVHLIYKASVYFYFEFWVISLVEFDHFCLEIFLNPGFFNTILSLFPFFLWFILLSPFYASVSLTLTDSLNIIFLKVSLLVGFCCVTNHPKAQWYRTKIYSASWLKLRLSRKNSSGLSSKDRLALGLFHKFLIIFWIINSLTEHILFIVVANVPEGKPNHACTFQTSAYIKSADISTTQSKSHGQTPNQGIKKCTYLSWNHDKGQLHNASIGEWRIITSNLIY